MRRNSLDVMVLFALALALLLLSPFSANAQWRSKTHDLYEALTGIQIKVDGNMGDWKGVLEAIKGTDGKPFTGIKNETKAGPEAAFEELGGKWDGPQDHETSVMMVWEPAAFYIGLIVTDDEHENKANSGWNGDAFQLAFEMTGKRQAGASLLLYNFALGGDNKLVINYEKTLGVNKVDVAIVRDNAAKKTYYETKFTPEELGVKGGKYEPGIEFGVGICVNDGDLAAGQEGQKGWSGWYTHSIVFGKDADKTGLVRLSPGRATVVEAADKLTTTWGWLKKR